MNEKTKALLIMVGILLACILAISYAFYQLSFVGGDDNVRGGTRCFDLHFEDLNAIHMPATLPISEAEGILTDPYTFTITNICNTKIRYEVNLEVLNPEAENALGLQFIRYKFGIGNDETPTLLGSATTVTSTITGSQAKLMGTGELATEGDSVTYNLRLWMDDKAAPANEYYELVKGKVFNAKISVISTAIR